MHAHTHTHTHVHAHAYTQIQYTTHTHTNIFNYISPQAVWGSLHPTPRHCECRTLQTMTAWDWNTWYKPVCPCCAQHHTQQTTTDQSNPTVLQLPKLLQVYNLFCLWIHSLTNPFGSVWAFCCRYK